MGHAADANELFEVLCDELRTVVGDDPRPGIRMLFTSSLQDDFDIVFAHRLADFPVQKKAAVTIENAAEVIERTGDIDVADIDMPVAVRPSRLVESLAF